MSTVLSSTSSSVDQSKRDLLDIIRQIDSNQSGTVDLVSGVQSATRKIREAVSVFEQMNNNKYGEFDYGRFSSAVVGFGKDLVSIGGGGAPQNVRPVLMKVAKIFVESSLTVITTSTDPASTISFDSLRAGWSEVVTRTINTLTKILQAAI